jgi:hypothetical protein
MFENSLSTFKREILELLRGFNISEIAINIPEIAMSI